MLTIICNHNIKKYLISTIFVTNKHVFMDIINQFLFKIIQIKSLDKEEELLFKEAFQVIQVNKNDYFLQSNEICNKIGFLHTGLIRYFVFNKNEESTFEFTKEGEFVGDYESFISQQPSLQNIQALEDCVIVTIDYDSLQNLYLKSINANYIGRIFVEQRFIIMVNQLVTLNRFSPEERYQYFLKNYKDLSQRIPQYLIASYVGVKPQSLSRIRKRIIL